MSDRPSAAELLALAREASERGEDPRLVARAIAIAERELAFEIPATPAELRRLAQEIRSGMHDAPGEGRAAVRRRLWEITVAKLRASNPDYLAQALG